MGPIQVLGFRGLSNTTIWPGGGLLSKHSPLSGVGKGGEHEY